MINDEDLRASEEYFYRTDDAGGIYSRQIKNVAKDAFLAGIEYERKRQFDIRAEASVIEYKRDSQLIEQVGEEHWRIKDGHE